MDKENTLFHQKLKKWGAGYGFPISRALADSYQITEDDTCTIIILREEKRRGDDKQ
jgi:hypothetical protein